VGNSTSTKFADEGKWTKSTYSTKTLTRAIVGSAMATRELLNVRDTARALGVHENTVRNWEERGILRAVRLPGSGYRRFSVQDVERLRAEMFEQLAPATEGPVVNPGRKRSGRLVFGDATE
jgi:excisionase family DNA binding protein